jgi:hypothetical protein
MAEPSAELLQMMENPTSTTPMPAKNEAEPVDTSMSADETPPMAAPMSTPEPKTGSREAALINIGMAMDLIEQSIAAIGSDSAEGQKILSALKSLTSVIGERKNSVKELQQSEILQMLQALPQAGGATPESKALAQAPQIPGMGAGPQGLPPSPGPV